MSVTSDAWSMCRSMPASAIQSARCATVRGGPVLGVRGRGRVRPQRLRREGCRRIDTTPVPTTSRSSRPPRFIVIIAAGVALATWISKSNWGNPQWAYYAIIGVALVALIILVLVPFVRWRTEHFVITNHHVFFRTGLLSRREHQIPLGQIANMETEVTFWGRLMGYGSLIVESSADQPRSSATSRRCRRCRHSEPADPRRTGADPASRPRSSVRERPG